MRLFKRKSEIDRLYDKHEQLLKEAHQLSTSNRTESDKRHSEAQKVLQQIEALEQKSD